MLRVWRGWYIFGDDFLNGLQVGSISVLFYSAFCFLSISNRFHTSNFRGPLSRGGLSALHGLAVGADWGGTLHWRRM